MAEFIRQNKTQEAYYDKDGNIVGYKESVHADLIRKPIREERFIKIYYDTFLAATGNNHNAISDFLISVGKHMTVDTSTGDQIINLNKYAKEMIGREIGRSVDRVNKMIKDCIDKEILIRIGNPRSATYAVSPFVLSKSNQAEVEGLQLNFISRQNEMTILPIRNQTPREQIEEMQEAGYTARPPQITMGELLEEVENEQE